MAQALPIKYAVIKASAYESGRIFIAPETVMDNERLSKDRARFCTSAYNDTYVILELRPIEIVK